MEPAGAERHRQAARRVSSLARGNQTPYNLTMPESKPLVAIIMGSKSDWETMRHAVETLTDLGVSNEARVLSAHRTPDETADFARTAVDRGLRVIIAGAGGAARLAGVIAADALNPIAVAKIFEAKERPRFDPLIVHLPSRDWLEKITDPTPRDRQLILRLADKFWPGPLTMVLPKRGIIPEIVTAGLDMVAVRISAHPIFAEIIQLFGKPLAAPSANRFGRVSPTAAEHVLDELDG